MTNLVVAAIAIAIGVSLSLVGMYQAKVADHPAHVSTKRAG